MIAVGLVLVAAPPSQAEPVDAEALYAIAAQPTVRIVPAADGTPLYTETYLPEAQDGATPPDRLPVVLVYTPYGSPGNPEVPGLIDQLVPRGYAVTFANVRGSGGSGGCFTLSGAEEISDGARIVEDAGELAPWASGTVGMFGFSYPGGTQLATATGPDRDRLESLDALVIGAPSSSMYQVNNHDGVPNFLSAPASTLTYLATLTSPTAAPEFLLDRLCGLELIVDALPISGNYDAYYAERDHIAHLERLEAATFMMHGHADVRVSPSVQYGLFDHIPDDVPKYGLFGVFGHEYPPYDTFDDKVADWYDHFLRGIDNGVDDWPVADVESSDGSWSTVQDWPHVPGVSDTMLLGRRGKLDAASPTGSTTYLETPVPELVADDLGPLSWLGKLLNNLAPVTATFTTAPAAEPYRLVGAIDLDLWVKLTLPDSHISVRLEVVDGDGDRIATSARTVGARSARHLQPIQDDVFRQRHGTSPPLGTPVLVPIRLDPNDITVPAGARLRLTVAGTSIAFDGLDGVLPGLGLVFQGPMWPSGLVQPVTILHNRAHPSALSFVTEPAE